MRELSKRQSRMLPVRRSFVLGVTLVLAAATRADEAVDHWAWKAVVCPAVPSGLPSTGNPIDSFVRARLTAAGLTPAPPASREQLLRRVTFDLIGLPPTPREIDAFVADTSPDAWAKVIDRLLASPHYGERWARHWLDLVRYADTNGYEFDEPRPDAWRYRDYVIQAFNSDKPYDRFVIEQLAGDEAFPGEPTALVATGFNLLGPDMTDSSDQPLRRMNTLVDMTDTTALAFLGMTLTCARCHDHKFEPIPQTDYYRLLAFFAPARFRHNLHAVTPPEEEAYAAALREYDSLTRGLRDEIAAVEEPVRTRLRDAKLSRLSEEARLAHRTPEKNRDGGQLELVAQTERFIRVSDAEVVKALTAGERARLDELKRRLKSFDPRRPPTPPLAMGLSDLPGPPAKTYLLERGELANRGPEVQPGFPVVLTSGQPVPATIVPVPNSSGRRLALAKWVVSPGNPLAARVIVNRLWQHHFGRGLVATPSDFGTRGRVPTHPELLDWLASELVSGGWTLKRLHRLMLLSETYQQSTLASPRAVASDPENHLLGRMNRLRLEGEPVRDTLLAVSGRLNPKRGGPGVVLPGASQAAGGSRALPVTADAAEYARRSIYLFARRNLRNPFLETFDLPDSNLSCPKRERSTTAPQALALLNADEALAAARGMSAKLEIEHPSPSARVEAAYRLALGRPPSADERERALEFLRESPLSELCRALFNLNEFVYLD
jgi:hypothetical protein